MNKQFYNFILCVVCVFCIFSCDSKTTGETLFGEKPNYTVNYIFIDITGDENDLDNILNDDQIQQLVRTSGWDKGGNVFNGALFRLFTLSNLNMTQSQDIEMKMGESGLNGQPAAARQRDIEKFIEDKLKPDLTKFVSKTEKGQDESELFANLCKQFSNLAKLSADKKNVIIYSDMLENSKLFSFYGKEVTMKDFENAELSCKFPELSDINVYVVPPLNPKNKDLISKSEKSWSNFFASKKANSFHFDVNLKLE